MVPSHTYEPFRPCWMVTFEALAECHDILILGKSLIKWRQCPDMTLVVDCDVKHQRKQIIIVKFTISKVLVPVLSVQPSYHKYWSLLYRYLPYTLFLPLTPYPILQVLVPVSKSLVPVLPLAPLYHKYWHLF